jgi:hypothetical protein
MYVHISVNTFRRKFEEILAYAPIPGLAAHQRSREDGKAGRKAAFVEGRSILLAGDGAMYEAVRVIHS